MVTMVLNSLLTERVEEQDTFKQTGLQWTNSLVLLLSAAPTAPECVGMNAAWHFSCLCCAAVKGIESNFVWKVGQSQVQNRLWIDWRPSHWFEFYRKRTNEMCLPFRRHWYFQGVENATKWKLLPEWNSLLIHNGKSRNAENDNVLTSFLTCSYCRLDIQWREVRVARGSDGSIKIKYIA